MSVSPEFMQQMLGGLLNYSQPSSITSGLLSGSDPTTNFGLSLLANSNSGGHFGQILGKSAIDTQQMGMQNAMNRLQLAQGAVGLGATLQKQQAIMDYLGGGQGAQGSVPAAVAQPPSPQQPFLPGISQMPQEAQPSVQTAQAPQQFAAANVTAPDISQLPINGIPAQTYKRLAVLMGKDPLTVEKETYERQLQIAQNQARPQISALDTVVKSDKPTQYVAADAGLHQIWNQVAPSLGFNPVKDFTDQNVRTVLNSARNKIASGVNLGEEAPIVPEQTINGALGSIYQKNPITGKLTQVKGEEPLKDVIDPVTGMPTNVRASQAEGKQPFNPSIFGASNMSDQAIQMAADYARSHGGAMPPGFGRAPAILAKVYDKMASDAAASGDTMGAITARGAALKANSSALGQLQKLETATNQYANTLDKNLDNLVTAYKAAGNMGSPLLTKAQRAWQQGITGDKDTAAMVTWLNAVQGEYAKLKSGSLGNAGATNAAMEDAKEVINKNMNEGGIEAVAAAMRAEKENRVAAIAEEKQRLMGNMSLNAPSAANPNPTPPPAPTSNAPNIPVMTPEQARAAPKGTKFKTTDGRILVRQ